jgi:hypothetical protein
MTANDFRYLKEYGPVAYLKPGRIIPSKNFISRYMQTLESFLFDAQTIKISNVTYIDPTSNRDAVVFYSEQKSRYVCFDQNSGQLITCEEIGRQKSLYLMQNKTIGSANISLELKRIPMLDSLGVSKNNLVIPETFVTNQTNFPLDQSNVVNIINESKAITLMDPSKLIDFKNST